MKMLRGQPAAVVFNGYAGQYLDAPLQVHAGQRVRIWVLDAGPSGDTSFHVVGAQFDTVFSAGAYLLRPGNPADGAAQTLDLMPGEGGFAEFAVPGRRDLPDARPPPWPRHRRGGRVHRRQRAMTLFPSSHLPPTPFSQAD